MKGKKKKSEGNIEEKVRHDIRRSWRYKLGKIKHIYTHTTSLFCLVFGVFLHVHMHVVCKYVHAHVLVFIPSVKKHYVIIESECLTHRPTLNTNY